MKKLILQALICAVAALIVYLLRPVGWLYALGRWVLLPLIAFVTAYIITVKRTEPYLAWLMPPLAHTLGAWGVSGYLPAFGPVLASAVLGVAGAAFGYTYFHWRRR